MNNHNDSDHFSSSNHVNFQVLCNALTPVMKELNCPPLTGNQGLRECEFKLFAGLRDLESGDMRLNLPQTLGDLHCPSLALLSLSCQRAAGKEADSVISGHRCHCPKAPVLGYHLVFVSPTVADTKPPCSPSPHIRVYDWLRVKASRTHPSPPRLSCPLGTQLSY